MKSKKTNAKRQVVSHTVQPVVGLLNSSDLIRELRNRKKVEIHAMSGMAQHLVVELMPQGLIESYDFAYGETRRPGWKRVPKSNPWPHFCLSGVYRLAETYLPRKKRYCERAFNERGIWARKPNPGADRTAHGTGDKD